MPLLTCHAASKPINPACLRLERKAPLPGGIEILQVLTKEAIAADHDKPPGRIILKRAVED